ncbi:MAG TPA: class I SAM-dependent methyltransferase [Candidatus Tectomicrobia bacterium]
MSWEEIDTGWGRQAAAFAYLIETAHWREYLHLLEQTEVGPGSRYLDIACGGGLAIRLACERGAVATGLDASARLAAIAAARSPQATIKTGDMFALPFDDASFDVATSFRGIWGNCLEALREAHRVVRPGGKVGLSFWGNQRRMEAYPLFAVLGQTTQAERDHTGAMVNIGRPDVAEQLMTAAGLLPGPRTSLRLHWEFPDIELAARALASIGPAYLAMQYIGEEAFMASVRQAAAGLYVEGIGVRAEVELQFLVGVVPG